jgi:hypothetical protein
MFFCALASRHVGHRRALATGYVVVLPVTTTALSLYLGRGSSTSAFQSRRWAVYAGAIDKRLGQRDRAMVLKAG